LSSNALPDVVVLSGARTPMAEWVGGKRGDGQNGGALAGVSAIELGAAAARAALDRADLSPTSSWVTRSRRRPTPSTARVTSA